jgi:cytochrome c1
MTTLVWGRGMARRATALIPVLALLLGVALAGCGDVGTPATSVPGGDPARGREAIGRYGCGSCHTIPGVTGANALVGPPLTSWAERAYIAGELPNDPGNLVHWIEDPQAVEPGTAMPFLGVSESDARDIASYLYTIK